MSLLMNEQKAVTLACRDLEPMLEGIYIGIQLGLGAVMVEKLSEQLQRNSTPAVTDLGNEKTRVAVGVYLGVGLES